MQRTEFMLTMVSVNEDVLKQKLTHVTEFDQSACLCSVVAAPSSGQNISFKYEITLFLHSEAFSEKFQVPTSTSKQRNKRREEVWTQQCPLEMSCHQHIACYCQDLCAFNSFCLKHKSYINRLEKQENPVVCSLTQDRMHERQLGQTGITFQT